VAHTFTIDPIWQGWDVVVIGAGSSLSTKQIRHVAIARMENRCHVIAVNDAVYPAWFSDWLHACDRKWWDWHIQRVQHFTGFKTTLDETVPQEWVNGRLLYDGQEGFDERRDHVRTGANGGYQAIHIAMHAGAKRILLLGFDMQGQRFFGDHPDHVNCEHALYMVPHFDTIIPSAKERGIEIINCTPGSALTCFRLSDIESEL
jgi:nicotinamide mononucleotide adenylyltransferase